MINEGSTVYPPRDIKGNSLQIVLMSGIGKMHTIWLPSKLEGRYRFRTEAMDDVSFIHFEAAGGEWKAFCTKGAYFSNDERRMTETWLPDQSLTKVFYKDRKYVLYVEAENEESNVFRSYYIEKQSEIYIGRNPECDIYYPNKLVSRRHAVMYWAGDTWCIRDNQSRNGIYVNGEYCEESKLNLGDVVYIMGLRIIIGEGFISLNDMNNRVRITSPRLRYIASTIDVDYSRSPAFIKDNELFKRQPRRRLSLEKGPIEIEMPPMPMNGNNIPLLLRIGSPMVMGSRAFMMGNYAMMLTSMLFPVLTHGYSEKEKREYEARRTQKYTEYLNAKEKEIYSIRDKENYALNLTYPEMSRIFEFLDNRDRLWERRKTDDDFLSLRVGEGQIPMLAEREFQPKRFEIESDALEEKMYELALRPVLIDNAPIMIDLKESFLVGINGNQKVILRLIQSMIMRTAVLHSYDEVKIVILTNESDAQELTFAKYLPHCWNDDMSFRFLATTKAESAEIGEFFSGILQSDLEKPRKLKDIIKSRPYYVVFALDKGLFDAVEVFKQILLQEDSIGVSIIAAFEGAPVECTKLIEVSDNACASMIDLKNVETPDQPFQIEDFYHEELFRRARQLSRIRGKNISQSYSLPKTLTFLAMFDAGKVEHLNPLRRWTDNNPVKSLATPVGVGTDGELFYLDLHEKYQGPHGLVAGMTGSGKSEFIITYILSMAVNYNPDEVAFILIDYKGGGLTGAFEDESRGIHLPHLVGTITNLDGAAIQRSLLSINSELKRRQALFNEAKSRNNEGTMDIYTYQKLYRAHKVSEPLPHLFIISDEFAELKQQQPEFMDELISTARIGRSLGVHLILATQKPAGVVNDQIWSNTKFRVCLKVQDKSDSNDMLKRPEAAELKDTGRFYLQVGYNEYFAMGQSAWCGADYEPQDEVVLTVDNSVQFLDTTGQTVIQVKPKEDKKKSEVKQVVAIVKYLSDLAKREGLEAKRLWLDPLPAKIEMRDLLAKHYEKPGKGVVSLLGLVDDPERQQQYPLTVDLQACRNYAVVGTSGSGKSTFLRTMLYSLVENYSPKEVEFCIFDFSGGILAPFRYAPHSMAYLTENEDSDVDRAVNMLMRIIDERKKLFTKAEVGNYDAYRQIGELPLILLVIDNYAGFLSLPNGDVYLASFHQFLREAVSYGIKTVVSCSHFNEVNNRSQQEIQDRIGLHAKDRFDYYELLNAKANYVPEDTPGRGMCLYDGRVLEYHTAMLGAELTDQEQSVLLRNRIEEITKEKRYTPTLDRLKIVDPEETYESFCSDIASQRIPLGYSEEVRKIAMPFQQMYCVSLYFGNPIGVKPILRNILYAVGRDSMDLLVLKRSENSIFEKDGLEYPNMETLPCTKEGIDSLLMRINDEILARKIYRNEYCEEHGLSTQSASAMSMAAPYIREHTRPLLILIESFLEFCRNTPDSGIKNFPVLFEKAKGFNFYFAGCFYSSDGAALSVERLSQCFNKDNLQLFFGGKTKGQVLSPMMPSKFADVSEAEDYNRVVVRYKDKYERLLMPCGILETGDADPDEMDII